MTLDLRGLEPVGKADESELDTRGLQKIETPGIKSAFKRGLIGSNIGASALELRAGADEVAGLPDGDPRKEKVHGFMKESAANIQSEGEKLPLYPKSPEMEAFEKTDTFADAAKAWVRSPLRITSEIVAESLGGQAKTLPLTIGAGVAAGPVGLAATAGAASAKQEYGASMAELLMKSNVDINDPVAVAAALNSPEFKAAQAEKMKKAAVVGAFDAATAGIAGVKLGGSQAKNIPMQAGVQATGGGAGEALGSVAAGEEISAPAVMAEAIGEVPGAAIDVGALGLNKAMSARMLESAAKAKETGALTGFTPAQDEVVKEVSGERTKPKLSPVQAKIFMEATKAGVDPAAVLAIASIETGGKFDPLAKNPNSSAHGLFQQLDSTWNASGGGDRNDPDTQIRNGITGLADTAIAMRRITGKHPEGYELYMGHLFGPKTAAEVMVRSAGNPEESMLSVIRRTDPKNAEAIVNNNGFKGLTVGAAVAKIQGWYSTHNARLGGDQNLNEVTKASPQSDAAPPDEGQSLDEIEDEIDALLAEVELHPPTEQDIAEARAEEAATATEPNNEAVADVEEFETAEVQDDLIDTPPPQEALLPQHLAGAKPRYGFGKELYAVGFESDLDRAAYIVANGATRSARDADYLKFVMDNAGMTEEEARDYGKEIRAQVKELASAAKGTGAEEITVPRAQTLADSGVTRDEMRGRMSAPNPNDKITISNLPIVNEGLEGNTLQQYKMSPGEVVALGVDSVQTPLEYMKAMQQTVQDFVAKYAPTARVALTFKTEDAGEISSYQLKARIGQNTGASRARPGLYHLNMRNAKGLGLSQDGSRNTTTGPKITYAAYHEMGHVLADHEMTRGMSSQTLAKFRATGQEALAVFFDETDFQGLSPQQIAVLEDYNRTKQAVLSDPAMTTDKFMDVWLSPWKLGHGHGKHQGKVSFAAKFMGAMGEQDLKNPARAFATYLHERTDILAPHEYMAEQMARFAYARGIAESSPLAVQFFQTVLAGLRKFFQGLKKGGDIRPGVAFAEWVDSLTQTTKEVAPENPALPQEAKVARAPKPRVKLKAVKKPAKVEEVSLTLPPENTIQLMAQEVITTAKPDAVNDAVRLMQTDKGLLGLKKTLPGKYKALVDLAEAGKMDAFITQASAYMDDEAADKIRWDMDEPEHMAWREVEHRIVKALPAKTGVKSWLGNALRLGSDRKNYVMTMRQMAFAQPFNAGLQFIDMQMTDLKAYKAKLQLRPTEVVAEWSKLGKEQAGLLEKAMREEHLAGEHFFDLDIVNKTWRFKPSERVMRYAESLGLSKQAVKVWLDAKNSHIQHMNALQAAMRQKIKKRYGDRPKLQAVKIAELHQMFQQIRGEPFLPQTRFGPFAIRVVEKTEDGWQTVHAEFFESKAARDDARVKLEGAVGKNRRVQPLFFETNMFMLRTLPTKLLATVGNEFELTADEKKELREVMDLVTRNPTTRRYSSQLSAITGANKNLLRNYADFMSHSANNISKMAFRDRLFGGLRMISEDMAVAAEQGDFGHHDRLKSSYDFAHKYIQHMMDPADEWHTIRGLVVVKMLWGNVKTAVVNLFSLTNLWAVATSTQAGMISGTAITGKAMFDQLADSIHRIGQNTIRSAAEGGQVFSPDVRWAMNMARVDGVLDESFAAQLAQFSNAGLLTRLNMPQADQMVKKIVWLGMQPQHLVEQYTRRVTLQTMFEIYMKQGMKKEEAYAAAKRDTYLTQGDNTLLNRPAFMRGKLASFTIFYGYVQNMLYLMSGAQERARNLRTAVADGRADKLSTDEAREQFYRLRMGGETVKLWMASLYLGGVMGLPGAEDMDKVLELVAEKIFGKRFSLKEYAYGMASAVAETASAFGVDINPRSIVHGNMSDFSGFGLLPGMDVSGSVGLGSAVPGLGGTDKLGQKGGAGEFLLGAMGPLGATLKQMGDLFSDDPSVLKKAGVFLPNTVTNIAKTLKEWEHGVLYPSGGKVTVDRETGEVRDLTTGETVARLMGFQPSIITENKELHWMQLDAARYWTNRRNGLLLKSWEAKLQGDREAVADVRKALDEFNEQAKPELRISGKDLVRSVKARKKNAEKDEAREARNRRLRAVFEDVERDFTGRDPD